MKKEVNIEKIFFPDSGELVVENEVVTCQIIDEELDPILCTFNGDLDFELIT